MDVNSDIIFIKYLITHANSECITKTGLNSFYIIGGGLMALTSLLSWKEAYKLVNCINEAKGTKKPE
ncbi:hypothetical protein [Escherichia coli]|uniref:hypothetical protein n=1 Tax=Escherichia coli TaxID=562 RepID=UPI0010CBCC84|nr:hypothetical protein [Escherichia coli]